MSIPLPDLNAGAELDRLAANMIAEATSANNPKVLSATGFARENISILHQQVRATNLAWALGWTGRVKPGDTVAIVGGSFSGLTLAVTLALVNDAIVLVFEKEAELLARFRDKSHRHLSRNLNSRSLGRRFDPSLSSPEFRSPIFAWEAGPASDVAAAWIDEYRHQFDAKLPIFIFRNAEVTHRMIRGVSSGVEIDFTQDAAHLAVIGADLLIDATGFGHERNPLGLTDYSYWESGHRLIYDHLVPPAQVLVSGCGDSGVIEGLHYAVKDFRHSYVEALWLPGAGLGATLDEGLSRARLDKVFRSGEPARYTCPVLSEVCWWLDQRHFMANGPMWPLGGEPWAGPIFDAIEAALKPHFEAARGGDDIAQADWDTLEDFVLDLPIEIQFDARKAAQPLGDEWISREIQTLAEDLSLPLQFEALRNMARSGVTVTLNGRTPTAYTRQLSNFNVWLMRLLLALPSVHYRKGTIKRVTQRPDRRFDVMFEDGTSAIYDRIVTRFGPQQGGGGLAHGNRGDTQNDDWLLTSPVYLSDGKYIYPARARIVEALARLDQRTAKPAHDLSKMRIGARLRLGPGSVPSDDAIYCDPLPWLAAELRAGRHPGYGVDPLVEQVLIRR